SGSAAAIARYSAALSTSSCQFSRYRGISSRSLMSLILIQPDSSRGTVTVHEPLIQDLLLGAAAVAGSRRDRASLTVTRRASSRGTVTVHEPLIQDLLLGAAAVAGSRGYRAILKEYGFRRC